MRLTNHISGSDVVMIAIVIIFFGPFQLLVINQNSSTIIYHKMSKNVTQVFDHGLYILKLFRSFKTIFRGSSLIPVYRLNTAT